MKRIVCSAIRNPEGQVISGVRHYDTIMRQAIKTSTLKWPVNCEQGFLDNRGSFLTRQEAWIIANDAGQIIRKVSNDGELFSENLY